MTLEWCHQLESPIHLILIYLQHQPFQINHQCNNTLPLQEEYLKIIMVSQSNPIHKTSTKMYFKLLNSNNSLINRMSSNRFSNFKLRLLQLTGSSNKRQRCLKINKRWYSSISKPLSKFWNIGTNTLNSLWKCEKTFSRKESRCLNLKN